MIHRRPFPYLPLSTVLAWEPVARAWKVSEPARGPGGFVAHYRKAGGDHRRLPLEWQLERDAFLGLHLGQIEQKEDNHFFDLDDQLPTRHALGLVMWAYFPQPVRLGRLNSLLLTAVA